MNVTVVGGGIGGLSAALALKQKGMDVQLFEAAPGLRAAGAGIWMSPNAMQVLERLGLADRVARNSVAMQRVVVLDSKGDTIHRMDMEQLRKRYFYSIHSIRRQTLHDILADALGPDAIHTGSPATGIEQRDGGVLARFEGKGAVMSDLLVGADGLRSTVRSCIFPDTPLRYSGQTCWWGLSSATLPGPYPEQTTEIWMGRLRFGFTPVDGNKVYFFAVMKGEAGTPLAEPGEGVAERLRDLFRDAPEVVSRILAGAKDEDVIHSDLNDLKPFRPLVKGRVALVGDAGHATTPNLGQGAAQALESGWVLAEQLAGRGESGVEEALKEYERVREGRIRFVVNRSFRMGRMAHAEGVARAALLSLVRKFPESLQRREMDRLYTIQGSKMRSSLDL